MRGEGRLTSHEKKGIGFIKQNLGSALNVKQKWLILVEKRCWSRLYMNQAPGVLDTYMLFQKPSHLWWRNLDVYMLVACFYYKISSCLRFFFTDMFYSPIVFQIPCVCKCLDPQRNTS